MSKKLVTTEPFHEDGGSEAAHYWTAVEDIVEWAGKQYLVVQLPLPLTEADERAAAKRRHPSAA